MASQQLFPLIGSKTRMLGQLLSMFPPHTTYVSVFGGTGVDLLAKEPSTLEVFNDICGDVHNLFQVIRNNRRALKAKLKSTPARSRRVFEEAVELLHDGTSPVTRAWAFLVIAHQGFRTRAPGRHKATGWGAIHKPHSCLASWTRLPETIDVVAERLKNVQQENLDFREVIKRYDGPTTLFFLDPPYLGRRDRFYGHEMTAEDHGDLCDLLNTIKGKALLCGYSNPIYQKQLSHWHKEMILTKTKAGARSTRVELVWANYSIGDHKMTETVSDKLRKILEAMSPDQLAIAKPSDLYSQLPKKEQTSGTKTTASRLLSEARRIGKNNKPARVAGDTVPSSSICIKDTLATIESVEEWAEQYETWEEAKEVVESVNALINKLGYAELIEVIDYLSARE